MRDGRWVGRIRRGAVAIVVAPIGAAIVAALPASCARPVEPRAPVAEPSASAPAEEPGRWALVGAAPSGFEPGEWRVPRPAGAILVDSTGRRWLAGDPPRHAPAPDSVGHVRLFWHDDVGLIALDVDRKVRVARDPLGPFEVQSEVPQEVWVSQLNPYGGALAGPGARGAWATLDLRTWRQIPEIEGRSPHDVIMGRDGVGIGLFFPQAIAVTSDGGGTWQKLPDDDLDIRSIWVDGDRVTLLPGGRDGHPLLWEPRTATFRALPVPAAPDARKPREEPLPPSLQIAEEGLPQRYPVVEAAALDLAAVSGDRAVVLGAMEMSAAGPMRWKLGTGRLGEGITFGRGQASLTCATRSLRVAACGGAVARACPEKGAVRCLDVPGVAVACEDKVYVRTAGGEAHAVEFEGGTLALAWHGDRLLSVHRASGRAAMADDLAVYSTVFPAGSAAVTTPLSIGFTHAPGAEPTLVGSCSGGSAAWLVARGDEVISSVLEGTTFLPKGFTRPRGAGVLGQDGAGALLFARADRPQLERLLPDGTAAVFPLSFSPGVGASLAGSLLRGHGLLVDAGGGFHQTDDGGESFHDLPAPPGKHPRGERIVCGDSRCLVGKETVRTGWGPQAGEEPRGPDAGAADASSAGTGPGDGAAAGARPVVPSRRGSGHATPDDDAEEISELLGCEADPTLEPRLPSGGLRVKALAPGVRGALFSAFGVDTKERVFLADGLESGRAVVRFVPVIQAVVGVAATDFTPRHAEVVVVSWGEGFSDGSFPRLLGIATAKAEQAYVNQEETPIPVLLDRSLTTPPGVYWLPPTRSGTSDVSQWLDGDGQQGWLSPDASELRIFSVGGAVRRRALPKGIMEKVKTSDAPWGSFVELADGRLILLMGGPDDGGVLPLQLFSVGPGDRLVERVVRVEAILNKEQGWALWGAGNEAALVLTDTTEGGLTELRFHPLDASLRAGPGRAVPGTLAGANRRAELAPCTGARLPRGVIDLVLPWRDDPKLPMDIRTMAGRRVRYDDLGACVVGEVVSKFTRTLHPASVTHVFRPGLQRGVMLSKGKLSGVKCRGLPGGVPVVWPDE
jgi:hypothetical protein